MSATVRLDLGQLLPASESAVWHLPPEAVSYRGDSPEQAVVWRFQAPNRLEAVPVEVGRLTSRGLEVSGELDAGDRVVAAGAHRISADMRVTPWEKEQGL